MQNILILRKIQKIQEVPKMHKIWRMVVLTIATQANKKWYLGQADPYILEMLDAQVRQTKPTRADPQGGYEAGCCCWTRPRQGRHDRPRPDQAKARHNRPV